MKNYLSNLPPGFDERELDIPDEDISACCGARITEGGLCGDCGEHC